MPHTDATTTDPRSVGGAATVARARRGNRIAVAVLLAAAALALSACQQDPDRAEAASPAPSPAASGPPAASTGPDTLRPDGDGHRSGPPCTPEMLRFHAGAARQPAGHMLLTVTNYSDRACDFTARPHPLLHFGDGRRPAAPAIEASRPTAVRTLAPGRTAYAQVTSAPGDLHKISQFGVAPAAGTAPTQVGLDGGAPVRLDPRTARVTYWQSRRADALTW